MIELDNPDEYAPSIKRPEYRLVKYEADGKEWFNIEYKENLFFGLFYRWRSYRNDHDDLETFTSHLKAKEVLYYLRNPPVKAKKTIL